MGKEGAIQIYTAVCQEASQPSRVPATCPPPTNVLLACDGSFAVQNKTLKSEEFVCGKTKIFVRSPETIFEMGTQIRLFNIHAQLHAD